MGARREYECVNCNQRAVVSGGPDAGMLATTLSVGCQACGQLDDLVVSMAGEPVVDLSEPLPLCRACGAMATTPWAATDPCPKCGGPVRETGERAMLWD